MGDSKISVIIPTRNRLGSLKKCLLSVLENNYPNFEIIIIDDFSADGTREYLERIKNERVNPHTKEGGLGIEDSQKNSDVKTDGFGVGVKVFLNEENLGVSGTRNVGIEKATGEWVAFIDDDCWAEKDWLTELSKKFTAEKTGLVIGNTIYFKEGYQGNFPERLVNNNQAQWPGAGNIAYRKETLNQIGGFDGKNFPYANEDTELALRAISFDWKYKRNLEAKVFHEKINWNSKSLLRSAHNFSVWPLLKKKYPKVFQEFKPDIVGEIFFSPREYLYLIFLPIFIPILALRYFFQGQNNWKVFFSKWPCWLILKRVYLWREALRHKSLII